MISDRPRTWAAEELSLLATVAHQGAAAVESGRTALRGLLAQEIHHRVKNNLQTVASLLRLQLGSAGGPAAEKALRESVNRICSIAEVHDLLTSSRVDGVDCAGLIGRLQAMLGDGLADRPVHAALEPVPLRGDQATALALVFCELFSNAVEHGAGAIGVELERRGEDIVLMVSDGGAGPRRGHGRRARPHDRAHARARPARGRARPARRPGRKGGGMVSGRVLIAEDETIIRLDLAAMLGRAGFDVVAEARDGLEAVELARSSTPDLALLDVRMPGMDGIDAARAMLEERPIPVVIITAYSQYDVVARAVEAGVFGYLVKPFREADLVPAIETARARHAELEAVRAESDSLRAALAARKTDRARQGRADGP